MVRATRSQQTQDKPLQLQDSPSKKRKRVEDSQDHPKQKLQRSDPAPYAATRPLDPLHAHKILHVLATIDKQGLLDRVDDTALSLRTLLTDSQDHTLAALRKAVQSLRPISVHPRAQTPAPAAQQQRFCTIALDLLDQASFHPVSLDTESVLLAPDPDDDDDPPPPPSPVATANKRYALMQHLPSGDYWTSATADDLKDVPTGHADLVAIFPAPSVASTSAVPQLGTYTRAPIPVYEHPRPKIRPSKRIVTCGSFLDYGPWGSFAPTWTQNGREVGMRQIGEVYGQRIQRYKEKLQLRAAARETAEKLAVMPEETKPPEQPDTSIDELQDILAPAEIASLKSVLGSLELENAVQELLARNRTALQRLGHLQVQRLRAGSAPAQEGSEEWDTAQGILDSLALLASLRPRSSAHPAAPLAPPPAVLHRLLHTLPQRAAPGWHGTLPARTPTASTPTALRDDTTVKVRAGVPAVAPPPAAPFRALPAASATPVQAQGQYRYNSRAPQQGQVQGQATTGYYPTAQGYAGSNQLPYGGYAATGAWYGSVYQPA
ncbi:hypothetical protein C8J57DRAFT_1553290, partial [Mycena rebaudengoi]